MDGWMFGFVSFCSSVCVPHQLASIVQCTVVEGECHGQPLPELLLTVQLHVIGVHVGLLSQTSCCQEPGLGLAQLTPVQPHQGGHLLYALSGLQLTAQAVVHISQVSPRVQVTGVLLTDAPGRGYCLSKCGTVTVQMFTSLYSNATFCYNVPHFLKALDNEFTLEVLHSPINH